MKQTQKAARAAVPPTNARPRKKARTPTLNHIEVRRGGSLRLRVSVPDDALINARPELEALISAVTPGEPRVQVPTDTTDNFMFTRAHNEEDESYHGQVRGHLTELFSTLCDTGLEDAIMIARSEQARRLDGAN